MELKQYTVTVRKFDPSTGLDGGVDYKLPVDSPDEEHAISAAMSNAVAFTKKSDGSSVLPVAFCCTGVTERV